MGSKAKPSKSLANLAKLRSQSGLNQTAYWQMFGVTQSGGSRYENGRGIPAPLAMLIVLQEQGILNGEQLELARNIVRATKGVKTTRRVA